MNGASRFCVQQTFLKEKNIMAHKGHKKGFMVKGVSEEKKGRKRSRKHKGGKKGHKK